MYTYVYDVAKASITDSNRFPWKYSSDYSVSMFEKKIYLRYENFFSIFLSLPPLPSTPVLFCRNDNLSFHSSRY